MRFYFDLTDDTTLIPDEEGVEARDVQHAVEEAERVVREMKARGELTGADDAWRFAIRDEAGEVAATVPLAAV